MNNIYTVEEISSKIISIISNALRIQNEKITEDSRFFKELKAESLDILDIRFSLEQEFGFNIGEHEITETIGNGTSSTEFLEIFTVKSLIDFIENKLNIKSAC